MILLQHRENPYVRAKPSYDCARRAENPAGALNHPYRAQLTDEAKALAKADHDMAFWMTSAHAQLGEIDQAFYWMERAIKLGNENRPWYETDKCLAPLRNDPRFEQLLNKIENR